MTEQETTQERRVPVLDRAAFRVAAACAGDGYLEALTDLHLDGGVAIAADGYMALRCPLRTVATDEPSALAEQRVSLPRSKRLKRALGENSYLRVEAFREPRRQADGTVLSNPSLLARGSGDDILYPIDIHPEAPEGSTSGFPYATAHELIETANQPGVACIWINPDMLADLLRAMTKAIWDSGGPSKSGVRITLHGANKPVGLAMTLCDGRVMEGVVMPLAHDPEGGVA